MKHCRRGHELTPENHTGSPGHRACYICKRMSDRRRANIKAGRHPRETLLQVPNGPLRERFLWLCATEEASAAGVCHALGWTTIKRGRRHASPDIARLKRSLGLQPQDTHRSIDGVRTKIRYITDRMDYEVAVRMCHALGCDPAAVGV